MKSFIALRAAVVIGTVLMLWSARPSGASVVADEQEGAVEHVPRKHFCFYFGDQSGVVNVHDRFTSARYTLRVHEFLIFPILPKNPNFLGYLCVKPTRLGTKSAPEPSSSDTATKNNHRLGEVGPKYCGEGASTVYVTNAKWNGADPNLLEMTIVKNPMDLLTYAIGTLSCSREGRHDNSIMCKGKLTSRRQEYQFGGLGMNKICDKNSEELFGF